MTLRQDEREQGVRAHRQQRNRSWGWVLGLVVLLALLAGIFAYGTDPTRMATQTDTTTGQDLRPANCYLQVDRLPQSHRSSRCHVIANRCAATWRGAHARDGALFSPLSLF